MKKILVYLLLLFNLFALVGCEDNVFDVYRVTVTGSKDSLMEPIKTFYKAGTVVEIKAYPVTDVTLHVFVNDEQIPMTHFDSDYWGYKFTMPAQDIVIHLTYDSFYGRDEYTFDEVWNTRFLNNEISKVAVKTFDYTKDYSFVVTKYSYKLEDIIRFKEIVNQKLLKVNEEDIVRTNLRHEIMFFVDDEHHGEFAEVLNFNDDLFVWNDFASWQAFRFADEAYILPAIENPDFITYSFIYDGLSSDVKSYDDESFTERFFNISNIEFIPYEGDTFDSNSTFYLDSRYGKINLLSSTIFELNGIYYEIVSGSEYWAYDYCRLGE